LPFVFFVGCTIAALEAYSQSFGRVEQKPSTEFTPYITWNDMDKTKYPREEVCFNSSGNALQGFIYGKTNNNGLVVISNGIGGTSDSYFSLIMYFVDNGWRVLAFNNTGVAGSEGDSIRGLTQSVIDLDNALTYIEKTGAFNGLPVMLAGHSLGGYAVCAVLNYNHNVRAVASFAGFNNSGEIFKEQGVSMFGNWFYLLTPQTWAIEKQLFGDTAKLTAVGGINKSGIPVMIVHCSNDEFIPANTTSIYAHRNEISNPHVEIVFREGENATGHEYPFCSIQQKAYFDLAEGSWQTYKAGHKNPSRFQWAQEYNFDKVKAYELDPDLMERINKMFNNAK
jgi:pimeloyl-ACP methyl ester carboxylesterase